MAKREKKSNQDSTILYAFRIAIILIGAILILYFLGPLINPIINLSPTSSFSTMLTSITSTITLGATVITTDTTTATSIPPTFTNTSTVTSVPTAMLTNTITATATTSVTPTLTFDFDATPTRFPNPVRNPVGTNLPRGFLIDAWHNDYIECDSNTKHYTVSIYGAEIYRGNSPYEFTFWQYDNKYEPIVKSVTPLDNHTDLVEFEKPVVVSKGRYVHVTLVFELADNSVVTWIDDLYFPYPDSSRCK